MPGVVAAVVFKALVGEVAAARLLLESLESVEEAAALEARIRVLEECLRIQRGRGRKLENQHRGNVILMGAS